jgi:oxygen-independent coproporphyrinogen-3 oxidase
MFAVPGETLADWRADLDTAIGYRPEHVSAYGLTFEDGTPFSKMKRTGRIAPLAEEVEEAMFEATRSRLAEAGYLAYEISNFARPGFESRHNLNYWRAGAYLGIGAGAHSHAPCGAGARRWWNEKDSAAYLSRVFAGGDAVAAEEALEPRTAAGEFAFLHLRTAAGLSEERFRARFGSSLDDTFPSASELLGAGLLERSSSGALRLTARGILLADSVCASFV